MEEFIDKAQKLFDSRNNAKLHNLFQEVFLDYFGERSYNIHPPAPLLSVQDRTISFTGSSTSVLKPYIRSNQVPVNSVGFVVGQECIRTHALRYAHDNSWLPFGQAYFHIATIYSMSGRFEETVHEMEDFTNNTLGLPLKQISIFSTKKYPDLSEVNKYTKIHVKYDTIDKNRYLWSYGMDDIHGEGMIISVKDPIRKRSLEIGDLVNFVDSKNENRGIEFGYGYEFALASLLSIENPLELSQVFDVFDFKPDLSSKYYGNIEVLSRIKKEKDLTKHLRKAVKGTYNKYLKSLDYMRIVLGKSRKDLFDDLSLFSEYISSSKDFNREIEYLKRLDDIS